MIRRRIIINSPWAGSTGPSNLDGRLKGGHGGIGELT